jgi:CHAT domain-containing protein
MDFISRTGTTSRDLVMKSKPQSAEAIEDVLLWLWNGAVKPVLIALNLYRKSPEADALPRVWWVAGGLMGLAPIHAAGNHENGSCENTHSQVISSYTSTFKALRYARQKASSISSQGKMLIVAMPNTRGQLPLNVEPEVKAIGNVFRDLVIDMKNAQKDEVLKKLPECHFAHFACHGMCDAKQPSEGGLLLADDALLTVSDLDRLNLPHAEIAYLSACSTAEIATKNLVDEAIHLANSFQLIGFRNVIGTMWGADDDAAAEIAKRFYENLHKRLDIPGLQEEPQVAFALHQAVTAFKSQGNNGQAILKWGPFIHLGV